MDLRCHSCANARLWAGKMSCIGCPYRFWAGGSLSFRERVFLYCNSARAILFSSRCCPLHADLMIFFMDLTVASAFPLLWGYLGEEVTCLKPHCFAKSGKALEVNCGPWSVHILSGTPKRQNDEFRDDVSRVVVVLVVIGVISGQSE